jgi:serine/threonine-protein kinase
VNDSPAGARDLMTRERWARLQPLVDSVLDAPVEERRARIAEISRDDEAVAAELIRFIDAEEDSPVFAAAERERNALLCDRLFDLTVDLLPELQHALGSGYTIEREIGGGGMSRVFIADETGLARKVVIKVLPAELAGEINTEKLTHEIRLAASLQQANIVPVLSAGTAAGFPYYTMPLVEGRSLRDRLLRDGALPAGEAVSIMRDVARALAFAHSRGVVHRDIKPGNILLSDRTAVVTDFGIAKALGVARDAAGARAATGTPAYIAPEQAAGSSDVDHRADIYSFGCVAFELLTGTPPFAGRSSREIIDAHFHQSARPVSELRAEVPELVARLIASCLEKGPASRPQSATEILSVLDSPAIHFDVKRGNPSRTWIGVASTAFLLVAVAAVTYYKSAFSAPHPLTFAAIPFVNAARDTSLDYRSDGIGDEILNGMSKISGVQVVGRNTAFRYKQKTEDLPAIQRALGARLLLTGTLRENQGRVIVSAQVTDSMSRGEVWSESFTHDASGLGSITDEMVQRIANALRIRYGSRIAVPPRGVVTAGTTNAAALDLYLIGQSQVRRRGAGITQSAVSFQRAIELDSGYARAHAALATALALDPFFNGTPAKAVTGRIVAEARRALELDSTLAEAHAALSSAHAYLAQWNMSDGEMRRAIALDPDNAMIRQTFARLLLIRGRTDEALGQLERARIVEPTSPLISAWLAYAFFLAGRTDSAIVESERTIALDPVGLPTTNLVSLVGLGLGQRDMVRQLATVPVDKGMTNSAYVYAKLGDTVTANRINREMEHRVAQPWFTDVSRASVLLATGDSAGALSAIERSAHDSGPMWVFFIPLGDPAFDRVRGSGRFAALLRQANLDPRTVSKRRPNVGRSARLRM